MWATFHEKDEHVIIFWQRIVLTNIKLEIFQIGNTQFNFESI